jgi:phosphatidylglycerophosphatase C
VTPDGRLEVAAFDFDGTLTRHDTFVPFLVRLCGWPAVSAALVASLPRARSRDTLKEAVCERLLAGRSQAEIEAEGRRYAGEIVAGRLRPEGLARLAWHRERGHALLIVSASPTAYLAEVGLQLGVDGVLATQLEAVDGVLTGRLVGGNCRGPAKAARVDAWLDGRAATLWAYGDSKGDRELLGLADHPIWVRKGAYDPAGSTPA